MKYSKFAPFKYVNGIEEQYALYISLFQNRRLCNFSGTALPKNVTEVFFLLNSASLM
jgi:hypothetical protein